MFPFIYLLLTTIVNFGCCLLIITLSYTNSFTFDAVCSCALTMRTENFFCFWSDICTGTCLWFIFADLDVHAYQGKGSLLWFICIFYQPQKFPLPSYFSSCGYYFSPRSNFIVISRRDNALVADSRT